MLSVLPRVRLLGFYNPRVVLVTVIPQTAEPIPRGAAWFLPHCRRGMAVRAACRVVLAVRAFRPGSAVPVTLST